MWEQASFCCWWPSVATLTTDGPRGWEVALRLPRGLNGSSDFTVRLCPLSEPPVPCAGSSSLV